MSYNIQTQHRYCERVLTKDEIVLHDNLGHDISERFAHARAKRVMNSSKKFALRDHLDHCEPVDGCHYRDVECEEWFSVQKHLLGSLLKHNPSELELAEHILSPKSPSKLYRYYYYFRFPGMLKVNHEQAA